MIAKHICKLPLPTSSEEHIQKMWHYQTVILHHIIERAQMNVVTGINNYLLICILVVNNCMPGMKAETVS